MDPVFLDLAAAADFLGPGAIETPRFESEIIDMVRRRGVLGQRVRNVPATGQPTRYFEQTRYLHNVDVFAYPASSAGADRDLECQGEGGAGEDAGGWGPYWAAVPVHARAAPHHAPATGCGRLAGRAA